jgi:hypothetical protein
MDIGFPGKRLFQERTDLSRRFLLCASVGALAALSLEGCDLAGSRCRFKLHCSARIADQTLSGTSVIEVYSSPEIIKLGGMPSRHTYVRGEALVLSGALPPLFLTMNVVGPASTLPVAIVEAYFGRVDGPDDFGAKLDRLARGGEQGRTVTIVAENIPTILRFGDLANPASVMMVAEGSELGSLIPDSVKLTCKVTKESVSRQLERYIPWVYGMGDQVFKPVHAGDDWSLAATTTKHSFVGS